MFRNFRDFMKDESGATFLEYGILVGLVGVIIILSIGDVVTVLTGLLDYLTEVLNGIFE
ncbi:Flp family type IVb pilin [uncultured Cohaesibacter sp.]|uniref:Flp family type IVb pilin n=1 Tax=uncultured Cohaesibacter sp. TaxID=1002546 RepID=UPI0029309CB0|nr:Flp family type IVb pilin [uncultured Cohaesibacter sp.]